MTKQMSTSSPIYMNPDRPLKERVDDLVARMTLKEKVAQMLHAATAVERLGVPEYNWWNECLHGVGRAGIATVFPQAIGLAAMWDRELLETVTTAISDEARAKHHEALREDNREIYFGLTFWTPNINIFRDPRWGRGQETYGEDPYLTAQLGVIFVRALQGDHDTYLKLVATPKHFAVHSGPEESRHSFDAQVEARDLRETYLPAFAATVREGKAYSVMGAYNRTNGEPCCASPTLLQRILREEWGFQGYVVSDCWAIVDLWKHHQVVATPAEAAALAVHHGCDLNCGCTFGSLVDAVEQGLISEAEIDRSVARLFTARFRLGMFDPVERVPYAHIPYDVTDCPAHRALALQAAHESMVLLKNDDDFLPLDRSLARIAVIGPNADDAQVLLGNYNGTPAYTVTPLEGIRRKVEPQTNVVYAKGCAIRDRSRAGFDEAVALAREADVVIAVMGLSQLIEGEEGQQEGVKGDQKSSGDRADLDLPGEQEALLQALHATGTPMVLVLLNGSAVAVNWADEHAAAVLEAWYPGQEGGTAIADVLFGDYNPAGRLPVTFYRSVEDLPDFEDYRMQGRTYRFFGGQPLYAFGHGLSYTRFAYDDLQITPAVAEAGTDITVGVRVRNCGDRGGDEVVQLYVQDVEASDRIPIRQLQGFTRIHLEPGEARQVAFHLTPRQLAMVDANGHFLLEPGRFQIVVGGGQPGTGAPTITDTLEITGDAALPVS